MPAVQTTATVQVTRFLLSNGTAVCANYLSHLNLKLSSSLSQSLTQSVVAVLQDEECWSCGPDQLERGN